MLYDIDVCRTVDDNRGFFHVLDHFWCCTFANEILNTLFKIINKLLAFCIYGQSVHQYKFTCHDFFFAARFFVVAARFWLDN